MELLLYQELGYLKRKLSTINLRRVPPSIYDQSGNDIGMAFFIGLRYSRHHHQEKQHHILLEVGLLHAFLGLVTFISPNRQCYSISQKLWCWAPSDTPQSRWPAQTWLLTQKKKKKPKTGNKMKKNEACTRGRNVVIFSSTSWWSKSFKSWWEVLSGFNTWKMPYPLCNSCRWNRDQVNRTLDSKKKRPDINKKQNKHPHISKKHGMTVKMENLKCEIIKLERLPTGKSGLASNKLSSVPCFLCKSSHL